MKNTLSRIMFWAFFRMNILSVWTYEVPQVFDCDCVIEPVGP